MSANELKHIAHVKSLFQWHFVLSLYFTHNSNQVQQCVLHLLTDYHFLNQGTHEVFFEDVLNERVADAIKLL